MKKSQRKNSIWKKTGGICAHCGRPATGTNKTVDHFVPKSKGGGYDKRNLMPLCKKCNGARKSDIIDPFEFYKYAPKWAILLCLQYKHEWEVSGQSGNGLKYNQWF